MLQLSQLKEILKHPNIEEHYKAIKEVLLLYQINTPLRISHFLAQILHESGGFKWLEEIWGPTKDQLSYEGRIDLGNTEPGDGKRYLGRGFIMITGRGMYREIGNKLNLPLESQPELAEKPKTAALIAAEFWKKHNLNELADANNLKQITRIVNGGYNGLDDRIKWFNKCREVIMTKDKPTHLLTIKDTTHIKDLSSEQIKELQELLEEHGHDVGEIDGIYGNNTLFAFNQFKKKHQLTHPNFIGITTVQHLLDFEYEEETAPDQEPPVAPDNGYTVTSINWSDFNCPIGKYFTVGEVLRYDKRRIPTSDATKQQILRIVKEADKIREAWGSPIGITSGFRPPVINANVGGVRNSRHIVGDALDIYPIGKSGKQFEQWLDARWYGGLGWGQRKSRGFTHIDLANGKGFESGGSKGRRWNY